MWSKIKQITMPISIKLTILYAAILFCILLVTSLLAMASLYYILYDQVNEDIQISSRNVANYLAVGNPVGERLLEENLLVPGVVLQIFDEPNQLLVNNLHNERGKHLKPAKIYEVKGVNPANILPVKMRSLQLVHVGDDYFYHIAQTVSQDGRTYQLHFLKPMWEQFRFFNKLIRILLVTNAFGLLIAIIAGIYISRKTLRPIRDITNTAKEIEVKDLGKRIPVSDSNDELQELAKTFNHMLSRLQAGFEQQRRFVADASHELRTPITVISGYADMLDRWGKQDEAALNEGIAAIKSEAANMHGLIEKLLFLARSDQHKHVINKAPLAMAPLIADLFQETKLIAPKHQISLDQNDAATICADPIFFKEMLRAFIENSIKYTPEGGSIRLASRKADQVLFLSVADNGIGIPEKDQPKIFDRFYRVDKSRSKSTGGAGLGLSIAGWIADQHACSIHLTSTPGTGTTVTVQVPCMDKQQR